MTCASFTTVQTLNVRIIKNTVDKIVGPDRLLDMETIEAYIDGQPQSKGSKNGYYRGGRVVLVDQNKKAKPYEKSIKAALKGKVDELYLGPVYVDISFHMKRGKTVKRESPTTRPDIDKMVRCVLDALTGTIYKDDSQVTMLRASKVYAECTPGTYLKIELA